LTSSRRVLSLVCQRLTRHLVLSRSFSFLFSYSAVHRSVLTRMMSQWTFFYMFWGNRVTRMCVLIYHLMFSTSVSLPWQLVTKDVNTNQTNSSCVCVCVCGVLVAPLNLHAGANMQSDWQLFCTLYLDRMRYVNAYFAVYSTALWSNRPSITTWARFRLLLVLLCTINLSCFIVSWHCSTVISALMYCKGALNALFIVEYTLLVMPTFCSYWVCINLMLKLCT